MNPTASATFKDPKRSNSPFKMHTNLERFFTVLFLKDINLVKGMTLDLARVAAKELPGRTGYELYGINMDSETATNFQLDARRLGLDVTISFHGDYGIYTVRVKSDRPSHDEMISMIESLKANYPEFFENDFARARQIALGNQIAPAAV